MTNNKFLSYLFLIVFVAVALHMIKFDHRWIDDESFYTMPIPSILEEGNFRIPTIVGMDEFWAQPPLLTYLEAITDYLVGLSPRSARFIPMLFGIGLVIFAAFFAKYIWGYSAGLIAAFLVAADNLVFLATRIVRPEILVSFFMVAGLLIIAKIVKKEEKRINSIGLEIKAILTSDVVLLFVVFSLAIASHVNGFMVPLCVGIFWLFVAAKPFFKRVPGFVFIGVIGVMAILPFALWIAYFDFSNNFEILKSMWLGRYSRNTGEMTGIWNLLIHEWSNRYHDFIQYPYRVHIALASALTIVICLFSKNKWRRSLAIVIITQLLFFVFVVNANETVRYFAITTPIIALLWASYIAELFKSKPKKRVLSLPRIIVFIALLVLGVSQFLGNVLYLWRFKDADYIATTEQIRSYLDEDDIVYGSISFWLGLRDKNQLIPYMRMSWPIAVEKFDANTVIHNDWVMAGDKESWGKLKEDMECYLKHNGAKLGFVENSFYGDMTLFRIKNKHNHLSTLEMCDISSKRY